MAATSLRSRQWWDNPANPDMTALYLERYLNFGLTRAELQSDRPVIGIAQTGNDLVPCNRHHVELAERVRDGIRDAGGILWSFRCTRCRRPASAPPRPWTATSPTSAWSRCCTATRSTASC
ncbi:dihydroxy-acid dehydratase domain-containing protein [Dactylosporangium darangshiense]|uniref:dihydroxy-acid dehydratase domain-containing protein n=1 Tax=Dactylosporangium darangshiense TaxID=579108 RepID=UPI0036283FD3